MQFLSACYCSDILFSSLTSSVMASPIFLVTARENGSYIQIYSKKKKKTPNNEDQGFFLESSLWCIGTILGA